MNNCNYCYTIHYFVFHYSPSRRLRLLLLINGSQLAAYVQVPAAMLIMPTDQRVMAMLTVLKPKGDEDDNYGVNDLSKNQSKTLFSPTLFKNDDHDNYDRMKYRRSWDTQSITSGEEVSMHRTWR